MQVHHECNRFYTICLGYSVQYCAAFQFIYGLDSQWYELEQLYIVIYLNISFKSFWYLTTIVLFFLFISNPFLSYIWCEIESNTQLVLVNKYRLGINFDKYIQYTIFLKYFILKLTLLNPIIRLLEWTGCGWVSELNVNLFFII